MHGPLNVKFCLSYQCLWDWCRGRHIANNFEVLGFVNPGAGMKYIIDKSRVKVQQLTKKDVVVLLGGS